jgi:subtilase family serine protease
MNPLYKRGLTGRGETIVIVDSYGSPTVQNDLATFDSENNLPAPPSFRIIQPAGQVPAYDPTFYDMGGWAFETTLDVEYAHTMAPGANILLVETPTDETIGVAGFPQMIEAENYVINHNLGDVITQSFGAGEGTFPSARSIYDLRSAYINAFAHRVTVLASAGDTGPTEGSAYDASDGATDWFPFDDVGWPSSDPLVTSVGGTQLHLDANGNRTAPDNVWNDTFNPLITGSTPSPAAGGGGLSQVFGRPSYQNAVAGIAGRSRAVPDVALSAAVDGAALVYLSFTNSAYGITAPGWYLVGGTSEASPLMSGIVAIADQAAGHRLGLLNPALYAMGDGHGSGLLDITSGNNTVQFTQGLPGGLYYDNGATDTVQGFNAGPGYDLASGLGTVDGAALVHRLGHHGGFGGNQQ